MQAFSTRNDGNMSLCYGDTSGVLENRKDFLSLLGLAHKDLVCAHQVHSDRVHIVSAKDKGCGALAQKSALADTDGLLTDVKRLPLAVFTADCLSVFLSDRDSRAIGIIHAGWRSTKAMILKRAIALMEQHFNIRPQDVNVGFGPSIRSCCYEVGEEFNAHFKEALIRRNGRLYVDLAALNQKQALECGVKASQIFDSKICTFCRRHDYFSYRREGVGTGRIMSVLMLI